MLLNMNEEMDYIKSFQEATGSKENSVVRITELARQQSLEYDRTTKQWREAGATGEPGEGSFSQQVIRDVFPEISQGDQPESIPSPGFAEKVLEGVLLGKPLQFGDITGREAPGLSVPQIEAGSFASQVIKDVFPEITEREKGLGYFGELQRPDGMTSTELSVGVNIGGQEVKIPTLVPTLTKEEVDYLLAGNEPTKQIIDKAVEHATGRIEEGRDPFAQEGEQGITPGDAAFSFGRLGQQAIRGGAQGFADIANFLKAAEARRDVEAELDLPGALPSPQERFHMQEWADSLGRSPTAEEVREEKLDYRLKQQRERMGKFEKIAKAMPEYLPGSSGIIEEAVKGMSRFLPTMGITAINPLAGAGLTFAQIMGGKYEELTHQGVPRQRAFDAAVFSAITQTPLEMAGNLIQIGALKHLAKSFGVKGVSRKLLGLLEGIGKGTLAEGTEEFLQQFPDEAASIYAANPDLNPKEMSKLFVDRLGEITGKAYEAGKVGAVGGALLAGVGGGVIQGPSLIRGAAKPTEVKAVEPKPIEPKFTGEEVAQQVNEVVPGNAVRYDGSQEHFDPKKKPLQQFTLQRGPAEGATFYVENLNAEEVRAKIAKTVGQFKGIREAVRGPEAKEIIVEKKTTDRGKEQTIITPEGRKVTRKPLVGIPDGYRETDVGTGRVTVHLGDLESVVKAQKPPIEKGLKETIQEVRMKIREQLEDTGKKVDMSEILPTKEEQVAVFVELVRNDIMTAVEDSALDKASTRFIGTEKLDDFIDGLPTLEEAKPFEVFKFDKEGAKEIARFPTKRVTTTGRKRYESAKKQAGLRGEKIAPIDKWLTRNFPKGLVTEPGIRKSGHYALEEFFNTIKGIKDIGSLESQVTDPARIMERIDQGVHGGPVQSYVLWPTRSATIARGKWVDKIKTRFANDFEELNITKPLLKRWGDKDTELVTDVLEELNTENSKLPTEAFLRLPKVQKIVGKLNKADQMRIAQAAQDSRMLFDELIEAQNAARRKRGMEEIEYRGNYVPHIRKANWWARTFGTRVDAMAKDEVSDFIFPNQPFNPRAEERKGAGEYLKERNIVKLMMGYVDTAAKDIFNSAIIENAKIYSKALRAADKPNSAAAIDSWISETYAGKDPWVTKGIGKKVPRLRTFALTARRWLTRAVFPLNFRWNLAVQCNSIGLTFTRYGVKSMWAGRGYLTDKGIRQAVKKYSYSAIIKSHWAGSVAYQDIQSSILKNKKLERGPVDTLTDLMNKITSGLEDGLTGWSIVSAHHYGRTKLGLKGKSLWEYATSGGSKTQSLYNMEDASGLLRNREVGALFPFNTFRFELMNTFRELNLPVINKLVKPTGIYETIAADSAEGKALVSKRLGMLARFIVFSLLWNMGAQLLTGKGVMRPSSMIPFAPFFLDDKYGRFSTGIYPVDYVVDFSKGVYSLLKNGSLDKLTSWALRSHVPGGVQINRWQRALRGYVFDESTIKDVKGEELFDMGEHVLDPLAILVGGPWMTSEGKKRFKEPTLVMELYNHLAGREDQPPGVVGKLIKDVKTWEWVTGEDGKKHRRLRPLRGLRKIKGLRK